MRLDKAQVKFRSSSGQRRSKFEINIFPQKLHLSDANFYGKLNGGISVTLLGLDRLQIEFQILK